MPIMARTTLPSLIRRSARLAAMSIGNREADPGAGASRRGDRRVDPDHLAVEVDQRTARVARVDRRVGLDESPRSCRHAEHVSVISADGRDDARGHRLLEAERRPDGQDPLAHPDVAALALRQGAIGGRSHLDHRDVGLGVGPDNLGFHLLAVVELDDDLLGPFDDVVIGDDVALVVDRRTPSRSLRPGRRIAVPSRTDRSARRTA